MTKFQFSGGGVGGGQGTLLSQSQNSKCQDLPKFQFSGGGEGGGGALSQEWGTLRILNQNLLFSQKPACASQIVSHILRMWRLIKPRMQWHGDGGN